MHRVEVFINCVYCCHFKSKYNFYLLGFSFFFTASPYFPSSFMRSQNCVWLVEWGQHTISGSGPPHISFVTPHAFSSPTCWPLHRSQGTTLRPYTSSSQLGAFCPWGHLAMSRAFLVVTNRQGTPGNY